LYFLCGYRCWICFHVFISSIHLSGYLLGYTFVVYIFVCLACTRPWI
jgi:hypothetical protein